jgi:aminoglycoside 3-N-acetyltransferase
MGEVTKQDIVHGLRQLDIQPPLVAVHSSLRSFGQVQGGPAAVIEALLECFDTVMMPGFQYAASVPPPMSPPPERNGCDYQVHFDRVNPPKPFRVEEVPIRPSIGVIARVFAQRADVRRSNHPWHSWSAWGREADELVGDHAWTSTNLPLERLAARGGWVLLMGVTLASCTAIHIAEDRAGRRPFIRWAMDASGAIREVHVCGCGKGFVHLAPQCSGLLREARVGTCHLQAAPLAALIDRVAPILRADPKATRCSETCLRCRDTALGGPIVLRQTEIKQEIT